MACSAVPAALRAHDFWIEPSAFTPAPGQRVAVRLRVGQELRGDPVPRDPALHPAVRGGGPVRRVAGARACRTPSPPDSPRSQAPGLYTIVYDGGRAPVELDAAKFEEYLKEEGLEKISALRASRGQSAAGVKEVFSRFAKSLIAVGNGAGPGYDRVLGQRLELVPETEPLRVRPGEGSCGCDCSMKASRSPAR